MQSVCLFQNEGVIINAQQISTRKDIQEQDITVEMNLLTKQRGYVRLGHCRHSD